MIELDKKRNKALSVTSLVMMNVVAVDSIRSLPFGAELGTSLIFYYFLAFFTYLLPAALITSELATGWPNRGGLYIWIREALGARIGFVVIWLQWIYNIVWYPTIMTFIATTLAYLIDPALGENPVYMVLATLSLFWLTTLLNCFGIRVSSFISILGATLGTLLPMLLIMVLGIVWCGTGHPSNIHFDLHSLLPSQHGWQGLPLFAPILFGLTGLELSAVHADEVQNPKRDYPIAVFLSGILIIASLVLASLAIAVILPSDKIHMVSGTIAAFDLFFTTLHCHWLLIPMVLMILLGALACLSTWVIGPIKGVLVSAQESRLPKCLSHTNRYGAPVNLLMIQGGIFSLLCTVYIVMPKVSSAYWFLSVLTSQLTMILYVAFFIAAWILRKRRPEVSRAFLIPGGKWGLPLAAGTGFLCCFTTLFLGFLPPDNIDPGPLVRYESMLFGSIVAFCLLLWLISYFAHKE